MLVNTWKLIIQLQNKAGRHCPVAANVLDCAVVISEFELQLHYYIN